MTGRQAAKAGSGRWIDRRFWATLALCVLGLALGASAAAAAPPTTIAGPGSGAGQVDDPLSTAVDQSSGDVYVADYNNFRIDKFDSSGRFLLAWGFGVADGYTLALQTCGPEATPATARCFEGEGANLADGAGSVHPHSLAVDQSSGDVYVVEENQARVSKFSASGQFLLMFGAGVDTTPGTLHPDVCSAADLAAGDSCGAGVSGTDPGELSDPQSLAVGAGGRVWVGDENRLEQFDPDGTYVSEIPLPGAGRTNGLALDSAGDFYVKSQALAGIRKLEAGSGALLGTLDASGSAAAVTVDAAGDVYVGDSTSPYRFLVFSAAGEQIGQFGSQVIGRPEDGNVLAVGESARELYVASSDSAAASAVQAFPLPEPGPLPEEGHALSVLPTGATLAATLNPEGHATSYRFEYGSSDSYGEATPLTALPGSAFGTETVEAPLDRLTPATTYHFRLVASSHCNADEPAEECSVAGEDATFTTPPAVRVGAPWATAVTATGASFNAELDPLGVAASWWVEYGSGEGYGSTTPEAGLAAGSGTVSLSFRTHELLPGTTYHYRFAARDQRDGVAYVVHGEERSLTAQLAGLGFQLADGRAWELVSPAVKGDGSIAGASQGVVRASLSGDALTYLAKGAIEADPPGSRTPESSQLLARHGAAGWGTRDITTPSDTASPYEAGHGWEYRLFSPDLSAALVEPHSGLRLSPEASERTPYLRENSSPLGTYRPLVSGRDGYANVAPGTVFGRSVLSEGAGAVSVAGASQDLDHVALGSSVALLAGAVPASLYEWTAGSLQLVSLLPAAEGGTAVAGRLGAGGRDARQAISTDGRRVFWTAGGIGSPDSALYLRDTAAAETVRLDVVQPGASGTGVAAPIFQGASADGARAFFTDTQRLTPDSGASQGGADLYECEIVERAGQAACQLSDLTPSDGGEVAAVQGLVSGLGEDGTWLYFVANGSLAAGASPGSCEALQGVTNPSSASCNLYLDRYDGSAWKTTYVASLSNEDQNDWAGGQTFASSSLTAAGSPDGRYFAFMSDRGLTGYDNLDAASGARDEEVYLYDAADAQLTCASCNPSGARPSGALDGSDLASPWIADPTPLWEGRWLAANLPDPLSLSTGGQGAASPGQPHFVSDAGRVFFNAADSLVPADVNGAEDVYEYEPAAAGGCASAASAAVVASEGGCVALISSGASGRESGFLDASASGDDAFFLTAAKLVAADTDAAYDVYDAHVCATGWPCPAPSPAPPAPCSSATACHPAPAPGQEAVGAAGSAAFSGPGNVRPRRGGKAAHEPHRGKSRQRGKHHGGKPPHRARHRGRAAAHRRGGGK